MYLRGGTFGYLLSFYTGFFRFILRSAHINLTYSRLMDVIETFLSMVVSGMGGGDGDGDSSLLSILVGLMGTLGGLTDLRGFGPNTLFDAFF